MNDTFPLICIVQSALNTCWTLPSELKSLITRHVNQIYMGRETQRCFFFSPQECVFLSGKFWNVCGTICPVIVGRAFHTAYLRVCWREQRKAEKRCSPSSGKRLQQPAHYLYSMQPSVCAITRPINHRPWAKDYMKQCRVLAYGYGWASVLTWSTACTSTFTHTNTYTHTSLFGPCGLAMTSVRPVLLKMLTERERLLSHISVKT